MSDAGDSTAPEGSGSDAASLPPGRARRRRWGGGAGVAALVATAALAVAATGAAIGHEFWPGAAAEPFSGGFGPGRGAFGCGSFDFGRSSPCAVEPAPGAPGNVSAISARVDPGLVDVTATFDGGSVGAGSGIVLTPTGEILTNNHVIDGATTISVTDVGNGRTYRASVVGYDSTHDIAVLELSGASGLQTAPLGDSRKAAVGVGVVAIGNAGGLGGTPTSAAGSITALDQSITAYSDGPSERLSGLIEANADVQPGDSGGALVDAAGRVLGMTTAAALEGGNAATSHQSYAIPIAQALATAERIRSGRGSALVHVGATAFLGVRVSDPGEGPGGVVLPGNGGRAETGATILATLGGEPAAKAGLTAGDVITSLNGRRVTSASALGRLLVPYHPGNEIEVGWSDPAGKTHTSKVELASGPPA